MSNDNDHDKVTPEPKRFRKYTSDSESDLDTNNMNNQSISDSKSDAPTSQNGHTPVIFQTTEGQSVNLTEIIQQTVISPSFIESIGPIIANAVKSSLDDAMKNYVSTLETRVKSQDEKINKLNKSNEELSDSNRMMNSRIDSLEKDLESLQQYGRRNSLRFHNVPMNPDNIQGTDGLVLKVCKDHLGVELKLDDIDRSHIIGNITNGKGQIICRLRNWKIKNKIYSNKSSLKNNPDKIVITEDLTRHRQYLVQKLNQARRSRLINSFWTRDGRIFAKKTESSSKSIINIEQDIDDLIRRG